MKNRSYFAFTLIEMLVVIAIIATIAAFAVPALTSAMTKGQMTGTMNNARQLYLAGYQMALDGAANSDGNRAWPGDYAAGTCDTLLVYCQFLVQNDYLKGGDLQKVLSAPGATCTAATSGTPPTLALAGTPGVKVYKVKDSDSSNTIFAVSSNYVYNTPFGASPPSPYGDKGFIVVHKGGDGAVLRKNNASVSDYNNEDQKFQAAVGKLTGDADGTATVGDGGKALTPP